MPGQISGGPSRRHTLANQVDIDQAERALQQRAPQGYRQPLPPPQALPEGFAPEAAADYVAEQIRLGGPQPLPMTDPPADSGETSFSIQGDVFYLADGFHVVLTASGRRATFSGIGSSVTEALSLAASALEEGLQQPVCPTCGQLMPDAEE